MFDPYTLDMKSQWEHRDGDLVRGAYNVLDADGSMRIVEYISDKDIGFRATVKKIPFYLDEMRRPTTNSEEAADRYSRPKVQQYRESYPDRQPHRQQPLRPPSNRLRPINQHSGEHLVNQQPSVSLHPINQEPLRLHPINQESFSVHPINQVSIGLHPVNQHSVGLHPVNQESIGLHPINQHSIGLHPVGLHPTNALPQSVGHHPVNQQSVSQLPVNQQSISQHHSVSQSVSQQPVGQQPKSKYSSQSSRNQYTQKYVHQEKQHKNYYKNVENPPQIQINKRVVPAYQ